MNQNSVRSHIVLALLLSLFNWGVSADSNPSILWAAVADDKGMVDYYLKSGGDLNVTDKYGHTALMLAADKGHEEMVEYLIVKGADPEIKSKSGASAADMSRTNKIKEIILQSIVSESNKRLQIDATTSRD